MKCCGLLDLYCGQACLLEWSGSFFFASCEAWILSTIIWPLSFWGSEIVFSTVTAQTTALTASTNFCLSGAFSSQPHRLTRKMKLRCPKLDFKNLIPESKIKIPQAVIALLPNPGAFKLLWTLHFLTLVSFLTYCKCFTLKMHKTVIAQLNSLKKQQKQKRHFSSYTVRGIWFLWHSQSISTELGLV